jgi:hypothetical protein
MPKFWISTNGHSSRIQPSPSSASDATSVTPNTTTIYSAKASNNWIPEVTETQLHADGRLRQSDATSSSTKKRSLCLMSNPQKWARSRVSFTGSRTQRLSRTWTCARTCPFPCTDLEWSRSPSYNTRRCGGFILTAWETARKGTSEIKGVNIPRGREGVPNLFKNTRARGVNWVRWFKPTIRPSEQRTVHSTWSK